MLFFFVVEQNWVAQTIKLRGSLNLGRSRHFWLRFQLVNNCAFQLVGYKYNSLLGKSGS